MVVTLVTNEGPRGVAVRFPASAAAGGLELLGSLPPGLGLITALGSGAGLGGSWGCFAFLCSQSPSLDWGVSYHLGDEGEWSASLA